jgi:hypothetical protein
MITGRPKPTLALTTDELTQFRSLAGSRTLPHAVVAHARLVLRSADGQSNSLNARRSPWAKATVGDRRRNIEPRCVQEERARLLNQDSAQKVFAQMKRQAAELMCARIFAGCPTRYSMPTLQAIPETTASLLWLQCRRPLAFQGSVKTRVLHSLHRKTFSLRTRRFACPSFYGLLSCVQIAALLVGYRKVYSVRCEADCRYDIRKTGTAQNGRNTVAINSRQGHSR